MSYFRDRSAPLQRSAPATAHRPRRPRHPSKGFLRWDQASPKPERDPEPGRPAATAAALFKVLKQMVRPARDHMTAKGRVLGSEIFLSAARRAAFPRVRPILSSVSSTHLRVFLGPISSLHGAALAPLSGAGSTASVSSSQQYVASLPLPGSSSVSALTRARTRRVPLGPDVRTRVSHGQQNADRCQPPGRNPGGGITW